MTDSDSSFEGVMERASSQTEPSFEKVPSDIMYKFKFKTNKGKTYKLFEYKLIQGKLLPYSTILKEKNVRFSRLLKPEIDDMEHISSEKEKEHCFIFQDPDSKLNDSDVSGADLSIIEETRLKSLLLAKKDVNSIAPFSCEFCPNKFVSVENAMEHVVHVHPLWMTSCGEVMRVSQVPTDSVDSTDILEVDNSADLLDYDKSEVEGEASSSILSQEMDKEETGQKTSVNVHNNPQWFSELKAKYYDSVVRSCTKRTREAFENNEDIKDASERRIVMSEILNATVTNLEEFFGADTPRQKNTKQVVEYLATVFPAMFKDEDAAGLVPSYVGYGLGGLKGLKGLPERICNMYRDRQRKGKRRARGSVEDFNYEEEDTVDVKKGKTKQVYGVSNNKWYAHSNSKEAIEALKLAGKVEAFEDREKIFDENRAGLMKLIRNSAGSMVSRVCEGFFEDPRHMEAQFVYLTETNISTKIDKSIVGHLDNMEQYLLSMNTDVEFAEKVEKIKDDCTLEFGGSKLHKYIHLLRWAGDHFDGDGSALMRVQSDGGPKTSSPHILAIRVGISYVFELWIEKQRILVNMDLATSISAFLHLVFCFNLKYPKQAETVCDFLQREVANYGNDEGTKTNKSKSGAQTKLIKYLIQLGKVLGAKNANQ